MSAATVDAPAAPSPAPAAPMARRTFLRRLAVVAVVGWVVRVGYILGWRLGYRPWGDSYFYHYSANLIAQGHGFIQPYNYLVKHLVEQAADHPPFYLVYLAAFSKLGFDTPNSHMLVTTALGVLTVVLIGLCGRELAGPRVGLLAAGLTAVYPNVWSWDGMLLSETTAAMGTAIVLLLAVRYHRSPTLARLAWLGAAVGFAALTRAELLLYSVLVVVPLVLLTKGKPFLARLGRLTVAGLCCVAVLTPWVAYNLSRFDQPVYLSNGFEITLATASCDLTYYGSGTGFWNILCPVEMITRVGQAKFDAMDQSQRSQVFREQSLHYIRTHKRRLPYVILARWGRVTGLYRPFQTSDFDSFFEGRTKWVSRAGMASFYPMAALAIGGAVVLRRRRMLLYPFLAPFAIVWFVTTVTFANNRYRASAEPALCLLAAVALVAAGEWWLASRRTADTDQDAPPAAGPSLGQGAPTGPGAEGQLITQS